MKNHKPGLPLTIPSPCNESWHAMQDAGPARRHCAHCKTDVVDVALLTPAELRALVARTGGHFCARITQRADGSLLQREPEPRLLPLHDLLQKIPAAPLATPVLATALLACGTLPLAAQRPAASQLSCADVQAADARPAPAIALPAPAPAPLPLAQSPQPAQTVTVGQVVAIAPSPALSGRVVLPGRVRPRTGTVTAQARNGKSYQLPVQDGQFFGTLPRGTYTLRADVRGDDGQLYVAVATVTARAAQTLTKDLLLQGPVMVTAGAPAVAPVQR